MVNIMIKKESVIPLYEQIKNEIIKQISEGTYEPGSKLPSEHELEDEFNTSRITIRRAIDELAKDNYLTKKQGKGTFINAHKVQRNLLNLNSYTNFMLENNSKPSRKVIEISYENATIKVRSNLHTSEESKILKVQRIMHFEKNNDGLEIGFYPTEIFPDLDKKITNDVSISNLLKDTYHVSQGHSHQQINLTFATSDMAKKLNVVLGSPLFQLERTVYDTENQPIYFAVMYYDPNKVSFIVDSK